MARRRDRAFEDSVGSLETAARSSSSVVSSVVCDGDCDWGCCGNCIFWRLSNGSCGEEEMEVCADALGWLSLFIALQYCREVPMRVPKISGRFGSTFWAFSGIFRTKICRIGRKFAKYVAASLILCK